MIFLTIAGLLIVSALIGVISTGLDEKLQELRKGRSFVLESGHTLVLGWSDTIFTILSELAIANENERRPSVVILAERDKVEMEDLIRSKVADLRNTRVICRTGSPIDLDDLRVVNPNAARSVVVLAEEGIDADTQVIKSVLALTQGPERRAEPYHIIAVIHDPANLEAACLVGNGETVFIDKRETISRLIVQSSRQSGASVVYTELLDFEGDEVYFRRDESLVGKSFGEALLAYEDCTIIGLHRGGDVVLNPPMETEIGAEDSIVAIAEDDSRLAAGRPVHRRDRRGADRGADADRGARPARAAPRLEQPLRGGHQRARPVRTRGFAHHRRRGRCAGPRGDRRPVRRRPKPRDRVPLG